MLKYRQIGQFLGLIVLLLIMPFTFAQTTHNVEDNSMQGKILVVMTNHAKYPTRTDSTGLWFSELTHFYEVAEQAGYAMDFVSPQGGEVPLDERSLKKIYLDKAARAYLADTTFMDRLKNTLKPSQVDATHYQAVYYTGGHGTMWDFPHNTELKAISEHVYQQGGVLAAVCHGVAGLLPLQDKNGQSLIAGRNVTGFSNVEETLSGVKSQVPFFLQDNLIAKGAVYQKAFLPFTSYVVSDDRLITGQNPQSPRAVGEAVVQRLNTAKSYFISP